MKIPKKKMQLGFIQSILRFWQGFHVSLTLQSPISVKNKSNNPLSFCLSSFAPWSFFMRVCVSVMSEYYTITDTWQRSPVSGHSEIPQNVRLYLKRAMNGEPAVCGRATAPSSPTWFTRSVPLIHLAGPLCCKWDFPSVCCTTSYVSLSEREVGHIASWTHDCLPYTWST